MRSQLQKINFKRLTWPRNDHLCCCLAWWTSAAHRWCQGWWSETCIRWECSSWARCYRGNWCMWNVRITANDFESESGRTAMPLQGVDSDILCSDVPIKQMSCRVNSIFVAIKLSINGISWAVCIWCEMFAVKTCRNIVFCQPSLTVLFSLCNYAWQKFGFLKVNLDPWLFIIWAKSNKEGENTSFNNHLIIEINILSFSSGDCLKKAKNSNFKLLILHWILCFPIQ